MQWLPLLVFSITLLMFKRLCFSLYFYPCLSSLVLFLSFLIVFICYIWICQNHEESGLGVITYKPREGKCGVSLSLIPGKKICLKEPLSRIYLRNLLEKKSWETKFHFSRILGHYRFTRIGNPLFRPDYI